MKIPSLDDLKKMYSDGDHKNLARWAPYYKELAQDNNSGFTYSDTGQSEMFKKKSSFIRFLFGSKLMMMGKWADGKAPPITFGADPEFILCDKAALKKGEVKVELFSSSWTNDYFGISEAEIGADYGLLEFRPDPKTSAEELTKEIREIHNIFKDKYHDSNIEILEREAVEFNHRKHRILEAMKSDEDINFGSRGKDTNVWTGSSAGGGEIMTDFESEITYSAYDKPVFQQYNDEILSAGGHIHVGGSFVKMLSFEQLRELVRKFDKEILPICTTVETEAAELRRSVYGNVGEFRIKDYGIEYRSPSNAIFWKKNSKVLKKALEEVASLIETMATKP